MKAGHGMNRRRTPSFALHGAPARQVVRSAWRRACSLGRRAGVSGVLLCGLVVADVAQANALREAHESMLALARQGQATGSAEARREARGHEVAALNSLGRSDEALKRLDEAEADLAPERRDAELRVKVLLPMGRCQEALPALQAHIARLDAAASRTMGSAYTPGGKLLMGTEPLLALAFCHAASQQPDAAVAALARVLDPFDASVLHYSSAWYLALRRLGAAPHPLMERQLGELPANGGTHAFGLAVLQGRLTPAQALADMGRRRLAPAIAQDAQAELMFFAAAAASAPQERAEWLQRLDALQPHGSSEWILARLLFPAR